MQAALARQSFDQDNQNIESGLEDPSASVDVLQKMQVPMVPGCVDQSNQHVRLADKDDKFDL